MISEDSKELQLGPRCSYVHLLVKWSTHTQDTCNILLHWQKMIELWKLNRSTIVAVLMSKKVLLLCVLEVQMSKESPLLLEVDKCYSIVCFVLFGQSNTLEALVGTTLCQYILDCLQINWIQQQVVSS